MTSPTQQVDHPSPHRDKIRVPWLLTGLGAPPAAWTLEMLVTYGISSNVCPLSSGLTAPGGFVGEAVMLIAIQLVCLLVTMISGLMSLRHWRRVRGEKEDSEHSHLTLAEGRTRFLASAGVLNAVTFATAILFNLLEPILIPSCWSLR